MANLTLSGAFLVSLPLSGFLKLHGLTVSELQLITGRSRQTLYNWYKNDFYFFYLIILGIQSIK